MRESGRQLFSASQNHESAGIIFMDQYKEMSMSASVLSDCVSCVAG
jgi:hypothetical protein